MFELLLRLFLLARLLCFMALVYLALHLFFTRLIARSDSKVRWFFTVVTTPLLYPVRLCLAPTLPESRLLLVALVIYSLLWGLAIMMTQYLTDIQP